MRWWLDVCFVFISNYWRRLLLFGGALALVVVAVVVSVIYIGRDSNTAEASGVQPPAAPVAEIKPTAAPVATAPTPTRVPTKAPTPAPTVTPTPAPTPETESAPHPTPVVVEPDRIEVPVALSGARSVGSLEFVLVYNPEVLELMEVGKGELAGNSLIDSSSRTPGRVWTALINPQGISGSGEVARFTFEVITPAITGSEVTVSGSRESSPTVAVTADTGLNATADAESFDSVLRLESVSAHSATTLLDLLAEPATGGFTRKGLNVQSPEVAFVN